MALTLFLTAAAAATIRFSSGFERQFVSQPTEASVRSSLLALTSQPSVAGT